MMMMMMMMIMIIIIIIIMKKGAYKWNFTVQQTWVSQRGI